MLSLCLWSKYLFIIFYFSLTTEPDVLFMVTKMMSCMYIAHKIMPKVSRLCDVSFKITENNRNNNVEKDREKLDVMYRIYKILWNI
jgi:hypothetical protein